MPVVSSYRRDIRGDGRGFGFGRGGPLRATLSVHELPGVHGQAVGTSVSPSTLHVVDGRAASSWVKSAEGMVRPGAVGPRA